MILIIDHYDSFTQNLVQCVGELSFDIKVLRHDQTSIYEIQQLNPTHILLSPGPGNPQNTGISLEIIKELAKKMPILGVCLGHQSIAYAYGGYINQMNQPVHGKVSSILHDNKDLFSQVTNPFLAARYHSLIVDKNNLPEHLEITAWTENGDIMGFRHKQYNLLRGIQFHPESIWTEDGKYILKNFLYS